MAGIEKNRPDKSYSSKEEITSSRNRDSQNESPGGFELKTLGSLVHALTTKPANAAAESTENLRYLSDNHINVYCS